IPSTLTTSRLTYSASAFSISANSAGVSGPCSPASTSSRAVSRSRKACSMEYSDRLLMRPPSSYSAMCSAPRGFPSTLPVHCYTSKIRCGTWREYCPHPPARTLLLGRCTRPPCRRTPSGVLSSPTLAASPRCSRGSANNPASRLRLLSNCGGGFRGHERPKLPAPPLAVNLRHDAERRVLVCRVHVGEDSVEFLLRCSRASSVPRFRFRLTCHVWPPSSVRGVPPAASGARCGDPDCLSRRGLPARSSSIDPPLVSRSLARRQSSLGQHRDPGCLVLVGHVGQPLFIPRQIKMGRRYR